VAPTTASGLALACAALLACTAHATQTVNFTNLTRNAAAVASPVFVGSGDTVKFDATLVANGSANPPGTGGLGLCLEYKRSATGDPAINNVLSNGNVGSGNPTPLEGCAAGGSTATAGADYMVIVPWAALGSGWPGGTIPVKLYDAQFALPAAPVAPTRIGFAASAVSSGQQFTSNGPLVLCGKPGVTLNRTANGGEAGPAAINVDVALSAPIPAACGTAGGFAVTLTLGGSATPPGLANADYAISGNGVSASGSNVTVIFPADGATTTLTVVATPVADSAAEGTESVTLTVAAGNGNYNGVGNSVSATIADNAPAPLVVEYLDTVDFPGSPGGHFFYSSDPAEQAAVDGGAAGAFARTGRQFRTGGTKPVCRFYGSIAPGPNSHFFTVDADECNALRAAQATPTPTTVQQWNYEGTAYLTTPPDIAGNGTRSCPANTVPLYRAYNNAFPPSGPRNPWDSNHRFTPVQADVDALVAKGWRDEGIVFCTAP